MAGPYKSRAAKELAYNLQYRPTAAGVTPPSDAGWFQLFLQQNLAVINFADSDITGATIALAGHSLVNGQKVQFTTTGTLPTGLAAATNYFIVGAVAGTSVQVSATRGGGAITLTGVDAGATHTLTVQALEERDSEDTLEAVVVHEVTGHPDYTARPSITWAAPQPRTGGGVESSSFSTTAANIDSGSPAFQYDTIVIIADGSSAIGNSTGILWSVNGLGTTTSIPSGGAATVQSRASEQGDEPNTNES